MLRRYHERGGFGFAFDTARLSMTLTAAMERPDTACLVGTGSILIAVAQDCPFGSGRNAVATLLYSERAGELSDLIDAYLAWARSTGCVTASVASRSRPAAFARLYRKHGFAPAEHTFTTKI